MLEQVICIHESYKFIYLFNNKLKWYYGFKDSWNLWNTYYHSVQNLLYSSSYLRWIYLLLLIYMYSNTYGLFSSIQDGFLLHTSIHCLQLNSVNSSKHTRTSQLVHVKLLSKTVLHSSLFHLPANIQLPLSNIKLENLQLHITVEMKTVLRSAVGLLFIVDWWHITIFIVVLPHTSTGLMTIYIYITHIHVIDVKFGVLT
jgi:hypothetical protein